MIVRTWPRARPRRTSSVTSSPGAPLAGRSRQGRSREAPSRYQEAELPFRSSVTSSPATSRRRDRRRVDPPRSSTTWKKTSRHMAECVVRYKEEAVAMEVVRRRAGDQVDDRPLRRSPIRRRPIFDYAEAFTVIDVKTAASSAAAARTAAGRGDDHEEQPRGGEGGRPPARPRDIGGIIVIDFIDMANPNRATVEEVLAFGARARPHETYASSRSAAGRTRDDPQNVTDGRARS